MIEFDLRIPVAQWLLDRGLFPVCEVASLRNCDLVGIAVSGRTITRMVSVELKLHNVSAVIRQCRAHQERTSETWVAMPPLSAKQREKVRSANLGLLEVSSGLCSVVFESPCRHDLNFTRWKNLVRRRTEYEWRMLDAQMLKYPALQLLRLKNEAELRLKQSERLDNPSLFPITQANPHDDARRT